MGRRGGSHLEQGLVRVPLSRAGRFLVNRHLHPGQVVLLGGTAYEAKRRLALSLVFDVAVNRHQPVLVASGGVPRDNVIEQLVELKYESERRREQPGTDDVRLGDVARAVREAPIKVEDDPYVSLSELWRPAVQLGELPGRRILGLIIVDHERLRIRWDDERRLPATAQLFHAPLVIVTGDAFGYGPLWQQADVTLLVQAHWRASERRSACIWVSRDWRHALRAAVAGALRDFDVPFDLGCDGRQFDAEGGVLGWRQWEVHDGRLVSPAQRASWPGPVVEARCKIGRHRAPDPSCRCGLYAFSSYKEALAYWMPDPGVVVGLVRGWGRVAFHECGWRSEYAQPVMFVGCLGKPTVESLVTRYEAHVVSL